MYDGNEQKHMGEEQFILLFFLAYLALGLYHASSQLL